MESAEPATSSTHRTAAESAWRASTERGSNGSDAAGVNRAAGSIPKTGPAIETEARPVIERSIGSPEGR